MSKESPDACQLTQLTLGSHTGTHLDAPAHFYADGRTVDAVELYKCLGRCKVVTGDGEVTGTKICGWTADGTRKLLIKGEIILTEDAAKAIQKAGLDCIGVEGLTVGPFSSPGPVHRILLGAEIVILEGLRMQGVPDGDYFLSALPLKMSGLDGSPVRAVLWTDNEKGIQL